MITKTFAETMLDTRIKKLKARAAGNYEKYHMFVECYGREEWIEFIDGDTLDECYKMMDVVADHWADVAATAF